jgi:hypothetical protein
MASDNNEMSRLLDEFDTSLFKLIRVRTRIATIVKRNHQHTEGDNEESDISGV